MSKLAEKDTTKHKVYCLKCNTQNTYSTSDTNPTCTKCGNSLEPSIERLAETNAGLRDFLKKIK